MCRTSLVAGVLTEKYFATEAQDHLTDADAAFQRALGISPYNGIAKKNLDRLSRLGDEVGKPSGWGSADAHTFARNVDHPVFAFDEDVLGAVPVDRLFRARPQRSTKKPLTWKRFAVTPKARSSLATVS